MLSALKNIGWNILVHVGDDLAALELKDWLTTEKRALRGNIDEAFLLWIGRENPSEEKKWEIAAWIKTLNSGQKRRMNRVYTNDGFFILFKLSDNERTERIPPSFIDEIQIAANKIISSIAPNPMEAQKLAEELTHAEWAKERKANRTKRLSDGEQKKRTLALFTIEFCAATICFVTLPLELQKGLSLAVMVITLFGALYAAYHMLDIKGGTTTKRKTVENTGNSWENDYYYWLE